MSSRHDERLYTRDELDRLQQSFATSKQTSLGKCVVRALEYYLTQECATVLSIVSLYKLKYLLWVGLGLVDEQACLVGPGLLVVLALCLVMGHTLLPKSKPNQLLRRMDKLLAYPTAALQP